MDRASSSNKKSLRFFFGFIFLVLFLSACGGSGSGVDDTTAPSMTLLGDNPQIIEAGGSYADPGATASDNIDGNITANIVVAGDTVNTSVVGVYNVTYNVTDAAGNAATPLTRTVNVVDTTPPQITLIGPDPLNITIGGTFTDPGATASDSLDGDITAGIVVGGDTVNTAVEGAYVVTYDVSDAAGNTAPQVTRTVNVNPVDTIAPVLGLVGANPVIITVGGSYIEPGATASDNVDGNITGSVVIDSSSVNTAAEGSYSVTYNVSDTAGNAATELTRTVIVDGTPPVITLLGANPLRLMVGDTYTDPGVTVTDNVDTNVIPVVGGDAVNTGVEGTYVVTYNASDEAGNAATPVSRTVTVDSTPPVITLLGANPVKIALGGVYSEPGATATDNIDGDISGNITVGGDPVNVATEGTYTVTYDVSDATGNGPTQATRSVIVDGTSPIITLLGANPLQLSVGETYTDPGATASDDVDGDITSGIAVAGDTVVTSGVNTFTVTYDVSDAAGNAASQQTRTVNVVNDPPVINSFSISPDPVFVNAAATFNWNVSDVNGDTLTCQVDVDNDGTDEYTINDCGNNTSQLHTYTSAGDVTAKLTVSDGRAAPVVQTINFSVIAPLSTDVSVDGPAVAGERLRYTITVGNTTALPIDGISVSFIVPTELRFLGAADAQPDVANSGTCNSSTFCDPTDEALWNLGTLAAGESRTISVNALVDVATLNNELITLPVIFSGTAISDVQINKNIEVFSTPSADLALSASTDPVVANETFTYNLDFGNTSAGSLTTTTLTAILPAGVTVSSISDAGTEVAPGQVVWNEGTVGVGASLHREVTVTAAAGLTAGQILKASARLTHDGGQAVDNAAEHALTVVSSALPLAVDISASVNPVVSSERVLYTLTVSNTSLLPVDSVNLRLRVPPELSFLGARDAQPDVANSGSCNSSTSCDPADEALWSLGTLAAGESRTIAVNALVASVLSGNLITTPVRVTATDLNDVIDLRKTVAVFNTPSADLALSASTDPVVPNETFTYNLDFGNTSAGSLTTTTLTAFLPAGVTISSISDAGTEVSPGVVVWNEGTVGVGASLHREVTVTAAAGLTAGQILKASARLTHDGGQAVDNKAEHALTVVSSALPLAVDISTSVNPTVSSERVLYTLTVSNTSLLPVDSVNLRLRVPPELSFLGARDAQPDVANSGSCNSSTFCEPAEEALWSLGTLAAGESKTITANALVASVLSGNLIKTPVRVTATGLTDDIDLRKTVAVFNTPSADLALSASTDPVVPNETFTYNLDFGNTSAGSLTTTTLTAFLPAGVTISSISDAGTEVSPGVVVWNEGTVGVGASLHREVTVTAAAGLTAGQILKASAQLTHDGGQAVDNAAEHALTVVSSALPLAVDISASVNPVVSSERVLYTLTVSNTSLLPVDSVNLRLRVPPELSFLGARDAQPDVANSGSCNSSTFCEPAEEALWSLGTLAAGESKTITANALVASVLSGNLITTPVRVTATGLTDDIDLRKTVAVFNTPSADLALSASTDPVVPNETFTYNLDFGNTSAGSLTTTTLTAFLPAGVTISSISDAGTEVSPGVVVWNEGAVGVGASVRREISVVADSAAAGDILKLRAELTHGGGLEVDKRSEFAVTVSAGGSIASLLSVDIASTPNPVASGGILAYTATITNGFGLPVNDVSLRFRIPPELGFLGAVDAEPDVANSGSCNSSTFCDPTEEALWNLGTIAAGATQIITINADVAAALGDGTLIVSPFRVTATGMQDTIKLQDIVVIDNP